MNAMRIVRADDLTGTVLEVQGDVDLSTVDALQARLQELLTHRSRIVEVDLHFVGLLDSSGVSMLLRQFRAYCAANKLLRLTRASRNVRKTLGILGLDFLISDPTSETSCSAALLP